MNSTITIKPKPTSQHELIRKTLNIKASARPRSDGSIQYYDELKVTGSVLEKLSELALDADTQLHTLEYRRNEPILEYSAVEGLVWWTARYWPLSAKVTIVVHVYLTAQAAATAAELKQAERGVK